eukprot:6213346-Pleurochrysis_carterae.AAC.2
MFAPGRERALGFVAGREARGGRVAQSADTVQRGRRGNRKAESKRETDPISNEIFPLRGGNDEKTSVMQEILQKVFSSLRDIELRIDEITKLLEKHGNVSDSKTTSRPDEHIHAAGFPQDTHIQPDKSGGAAVIHTETSEQKRDACPSYASEAGESSNEDAADMHVDDESVAEDALDRTSSFFDHGNDPSQIVQKL